MLILVIERGIQSRAIDGRVRSWEILNRLVHCLSLGWHSTSGSLQQFSWADREGLFYNLYLCVALIDSKFCWQRYIVQAINYACNLWDIWPDSTYFTVKVVDGVLGPRFYLLPRGKLESAHYLFRYRSIHIVTFSDSAHWKVVTPMRLIGGAYIELRSNCWILKSHCEHVPQRCILRHQPFLNDIEDQLALFKKYLCWHRFEVILILQ
jgi:hypothetical protein